jgi:Bacterial Ig-like domain (group 3)
VQTAFIQSTSTISQALSLDAGSYVLSFAAAQRACCVSPFVQPIRVSVDGTQIGSLVSPASTSFASYSISFSVASTGTHTITFAGTDATDKTTFIDAVTLSTPTLGTTLVSSLNPAHSGKAVTFTATVTGTNPAGSVAFTSNGVPISACTAVALGGSGNIKTASCLTSFATKGTYSIVARYSGDASNPPSATPPLAEMVKR